MKNVMQFTLALAVTVLVLAGCNKGGSSDIRVKQIVSGRGFTSTYTYGADNRVVSIKNSNHSATTYTYNGNKITQAVADSARGMFINYNLHLNAAGYLDSTTASDPSGTYLKFDTHDADGYTTLSSEYISGTLKDASHSVFKDGNEISRTITDSAAKPLVTVYFEYYNDKPNTLSYENFGMKYIGKDSKNLMKKYAQVLPSGDTFATGSMVYKFDDKGRVSSKSMFDRRGTLSDSTTFTY